MTFVEGYSFLPFPGQVNIEVGVRKLALAGKPSAVNAKTVRFRERVGQSQGMPPVLHYSQAGVPLLEGLGGRRGRGVHGRARRLDALVPLGVHIRGARLAHARRAPTRASLCGVGTRNRPQSLAHSAQKYLTKHTKKSIALKTELGLPLGTERRP